MATGLDGKGRGVSVAAVDLSFALGHECDEELPSLQRFVDGYYGRGFIVES
jgi:hypothetical protein